MTGFILALCRAAGCGGEVEVDRALAEATRRSEHGVLVVTGCLLGATLCRACGPGADAARVAVVQPCHASRRPSGRPVLVGPIRGAEDTRELCRWLDDGRLTADRLPDRMRGYATTLSRAAVN